MRGMLNELVFLFYGGCLHLRVFVKRGSTVYSCLKCLTVYSECIISEGALLSHIHSRGSGKPDAGDYTVCSLLTREPPHSLWLLTVTCSHSSCIHLPSIVGSHISLH